MDATDRGASMMAMTIEHTALPEVLVLRPAVHGDARGFFFESYNAREFAVATGSDPRFVQDNHSRSQARVLRGLHYQVAPRAQGKLVRVLRGEVFDVAVDLRRSSPRFAQWTGVRLDASSHAQMWIPAGFAHGFLVLGDGADVAYKTTDYYAPQFERSIRFDDPHIAIEWPRGIAPLLSSRDAAAGGLDAAELFS
jgi:dTDP-4-dehydrorhamnose 3,5-epimerase